MLKKNVNDAKDWFPLQRFMKKQIFTMENSVLIVMNSTGKNRVCIKYNNNYPVA